MMAKAPPVSSAEDYILGAAHRIRPFLAEAAAGEGEVRAAARYAIEGGGKRLRPALVLASGESLGAAEGELLATAAAWECVHTYSLIHDDLPCMDNDDLRRGRPSTHKAFGVETAVRAGAYLLAAAFGLVARIPDERIRGKVARILAESSGAGGMVGGQALDILAERDDSLTAEGLAAIHRGKTAALIAGAIRAGGAIARAEEARLARVTRAGESIGLAFQIADDILDQSSTPEIMGKPTRSDAVKGKRTYPFILGLDRAGVLAAEELERALAYLAEAGISDGPLPELFRYVTGRDR